LSWLAKAAVEAAPAHPSAMEQVVITTATTDDEKKASINHGDGHSKKQ